MRKALPKIEALPGAVCVQRVRCGKANCRCARGDRHPAFYRFWREGGRLRKAYVRRADLKATRAACARWREHELMMRTLLSSPEADEQRRQTRAMLRGAGLEAAAASPRLRSRAAGVPRPRDVADEIDAGRLSLPWLRLPSFRF